MGDEGRGASPGRQAAGSPPGREVDLSTPGAAEPGSAPGAAEPGSAPSAEPGSEPGAAEPGLAPEAAEPRFVTAESGSAPTVESGSTAGTEPGSPAGAAPGKVVAVVVSYNRCALLARSLDALAAQRRPVDAILVVDNASTDQSAELARSHPARPEVLALPRNIGGAGGFAAGIAHAVTALRADVVWLMDDDTIPTPDALAALLDARTRYPGRVDLAGSRVVWTDGRDHPMNTPRRRPGASRRARAVAAAVGAIPIRSSSFVSMLISADVVRRRGLPMADYFIWNDDFEYSTRLIRGGTGLLVPASVVEHHTAVFGGADADPGERFYFEVRNKAWMLTRSRSLSVPEKLLYGGSTLRRWARLLMRSDRRNVLLAGARRGLRDALRAPRPTEEVLAEVGQRADLPGGDPVAT